MSIDLELAGNLDHALELLSAGDPMVRPIAGATDAMLRLRAGRLKATRLVSVFDVKELSFLREEQDGLRIGAATPLTTLLRHPLTARRFPAAFEALRLFASPQIRNRATLGGNIGNASPAADMVAPLLALNAQVTLRSKKGGARVVALDGLFEGFGRTGIRPDELCTDIFLPFPAEGFQAFSKFGSRGANVISVVNAAVVLAVRDGKVTQARIAYGSVAPKPQRFAGVEAYLSGKPLDRALLAGVKDAVHADIAPIDDVRGSKRYKTMLAVNATLEALERALAAQKGGAQP